MKRGWRRMRRAIDTAGWASIFVGVGVMAGVALSVALLAYPPMRQPEIMGPLSIDYLDLAAQRGMNDAAWWMVILTALAGAVGAISLFLIRENLVAAREVNKHAAANLVIAERAVGQAMVANETAQRLGKAQVRAYVIFLGGELTISNGGGVHAAYSFTNSGQTPARGVTVNMKVEFWTTSVLGTVQFEELVVGIAEQETRSDIAGHDTREGHHSFEALIDNRRAAKLKGSPFTCLVDFEVTYSDVFEDFPHIETSRYGFQVPANTALTGRYTLFRIHPDQPPAAAKTRVLPVAYG